MPPDIDCQKLEADLTTLQGKIDNGIKQEEEFQQAFAHEIEELEELEDSVPIFIEEDEDIDYDDIEGEIQTVEKKIDDINAEIQTLTTEEDQLIVTEGQLHHDVFATQTLINDYQTEYDAFECDKDSNSIFGNCIFLNDILIELRSDLAEFESDWNIVLDRLNEIPGEIQELEGELGEEETKLEDLKTAKKTLDDIEKKEKDNSDKSKNLEDNKKNNFPDAAELPANQALKDEILKQLMAHCWNEDNS